MEGLKTHLRAIVYYMHLCLKGQGTAADAFPLIQHCPLVLTAILDFMAAFMAANTEMLCMVRGLGNHK